MKKYKRHLTLSLLVLLLTLLNQQQLSAKKIDSLPFVEVGKSYQSYLYAPLNTLDFVVLEIGENYWIKVQEINRRKNRKEKVFWLNTNVLPLIAELNEKSSEGNEPKKEN